MLIIHFIFYEDVRKRNENYFSLDWRYFPLLDTSIRQCLSRSIDHLIIKADTALYFITYGRQTPPFFVEKNSGENGFELTTTKFFNSLTNLDLADSILIFYMESVFFT